MNYDKIFSFDVSDEVFHSLSLLEDHPLDAYVFHKWSSLAVWNESIALFYSLEIFFLFFSSMGDIVDCFDGH